MNCHGILLFFLIVSYSTLHAQSKDCSCTSALSETWTYLQSTPAYRQNCRSDPRCGRRYRELLNAAPTSATGLPCYRLLSELTALVGDGHTVIFGNPADTVVLPAPGPVGPANRSDTAEAPAGEYFGYGYAISLRDDPHTDGYVLTLSQAPDDTLAYLAPLGDGRYRYSGYLVSGGFAVTYTEAIRSGAFMGQKLRKDTTAAAYGNYSGGDTYAFESLGGGVDYLRLGSFEAFQPTLREAESFYADLAGKLTGDYLIVDVRNNGGGGNRNSNIVYRILRRQRARYRNIVVLINHNSVSNAEMFAARLSRWKSVTLAGEPSRGSLAYESQGAQRGVGCGHYTLHLATKRLPRYEAYEGVGVQPEWKLERSRPWVDQAIDRLRE